MFFGVKNKNKDVPDETVQPVFLSCTLKTQDCLLNLICNSTLHIPLNITRQQRTMSSGFLGIKVRKTVHSFCPDGTGRTERPTVSDVGNSISQLVLPGFR